MVHQVQSVNEFSEVLQSSTLTVIDFFATWCGPCKKLSPIIEQLAKEYHEKVHFVKVDVDELELNSVILPNKTIDIKGLPTILLVKDGQFVDMLVGLDENKLRAMIYSHTK